MSKTKTPSNKTYDCNDNQNDSHDCGGFHRQLAFIECYSFAPDEQVCTFKGASLAS
jgi:hypothetical protein